MTEMRGRDNENADGDAAGHKGDDDCTSIVSNLFFASAMPRMLSRMPFQMKNVPGMLRMWAVMVGGGNCFWEQMYRQMQTGIVHPAVIMCKSTPQKNVPICQEGPIYVKTYIFST